MDYLPYAVDYAKSVRSTCKGCYLSIKQSTLRLGVIEQSPNFDGKILKWHHYRCFFKKYRPNTTDDIQNFENLRWEDQKMINNSISKKPFRVAANTIGKFGNLACGEQLSETNTSDEDDISEVTKQFTAISPEDGPEAKKLKTEDAVDSADTLDEKMKEDNDIIFKYRDELKNLTKNELLLLLESNNQKNLSGNDKRLDHLADLMTFGRLLPCLECPGDLCQFVFSKGGYTCNNDLTEWTKCKNFIKEPERSEFVVPSELKAKYRFLDQYQYVARTRTVRDVISTSAAKETEENIAHGRKNPIFRLLNEPSVSFKTKPLILKNGAVIYPDSGLQNKAHVYQNYNQVLVKIDIQENRNSYYILQLLKSDVGGKYWVYKKWGRIGTTDGQCTRPKKMLTLDAAKKEFEDLYEEKTGNQWETRNNFIKVPGKYYPNDIDFKEDVPKMNIPDELPSNLPLEVQNLLKLIFDIYEMDRVMLEFQLDTDKMPLGKLSESQIIKAHGVLSELETLISNGAPSRDLIDPSNRFYTLIPHSAGVDKLPILDTSEMIKKKIDILKNLSGLKIAYNLKQSSWAGLDGLYDQLKTDIHVLDKNSDEFETIQEYVRNTHAPTHRKYNLNVINVFVIKRHEEDKRFEPFKELHNHKLLWHGSRVTNFAKILTEGLRIAPPEVPSCGYMFGKGIYFADIVSKSANYCHSNRNNPIGLMLLCDVALGEMYERTEGDYIEELPAGKNSCKGVGHFEPNPEVIKKLYDIEVPCGKPIEIKDVKSDLRYNEFIVYDAAQVNIKYLLQLEFVFN